MNIPLEVLDEIKCSKCNKYLSRSPVYLQHDDGKGLCGQCFSPDLSVTRNKQYEVIAKLLRFPCKYRELGCNSTVPFVEEMKNIPHEEECSFREFICPVLDSSGCDWLGNRNDILIHCRNNHPDQVVENPATVTHDIRSSYIRTYLFIAFELLFLLHVKVCVATGKIYHAMRFLGDSLKAKEFTFTVDAKTNGEQVSKKGKVAPQGCLAIEDDISVVLSINSLLDVLGKFEDITFTVSLNWLMKKCARCRKDGLRVIYYDEKEWWCEKCAPDERKCENHIKGCNHKDFDAKCYKHEWYFCPFSKWCQICDKNIPKESLLVHYNSVHYKDTFETGCIWRMTKTNNWKHCLISSIANTAMCSYIMDDVECTLRMSIPVSSDRLSEFQCTIQIIRPKTNDSCTFTPHLKSYTVCDDWTIEIKKDDFFWTNEGLDVSIDITRIEK